MQACGSYWWKGHETSRFSRGNTRLQNGIKFNSKFQNPDKGLQNPSYCDTLQSPVAINNVRSSYTFQKTNLCQRHYIFRIYGPIKSDQPELTLLYFTLKVMVMNMSSMQKNIKIKDAKQAYKSLFF